MVTKTNYIPENSEGRVGKKRGTERILVFDHLRGLTVIIMVMVHVLNLYTNPGVMDSIRADVIDFMGGSPPAPVFMILMGVFFASSKSEPCR